MNQSRLLAQNIIRGINEGKSLESLLKSTKAVLEKYGRGALYVKVLKTLLTMLDTKRKVSTINIESAFAIDEALTQNIINLIPNLKRDTVVSKSINISLLAGFKMTHNNKVYDGSARTYIDSIQKLHIK